MKQRTLLILGLILLMSSFLLGCASKNSEGNSESRTEEATDKIVIYTSIYPLYDFAQKIAGDQAVVHSLLPVGVAAHDYEPTTQDIIKLSEANLFIYNGGGLEGWLDRLLEAAKNEQLVVVDSTKQIILLSNEETGHSHGDHDLAEVDHHHDDLDAHVWLDPLLAKQQAVAIKDALVQIDPEHQAYYEQNFADLEQKFEAVHQQFTDIANRAVRHDFVVAHAAFGYLAKRYGWEQIAVTGLNQEEPGTKQLQEIVRFIQTNDVQYILFENQVSSKVAQVVQEETGVSSLILHNVEGLTEEQVKLKKDYFQLMEENVQVLSKVLID